MMKAHFDRLYPTSDRRALDLLIKVDTYRKRRYQETSTMPTDAEAAQALGVDASELSAARQRQPTSFDAPINDESGTDLYEIVPDERTPGPDTRNTDATLATIDKKFASKVRAALADLPDSATAERLVELVLLQGASLDEAVAELPIDAATARDMYAQVADLLRTVLDPPGSADGDEPEAVPTTADETPAGAPPGQPGASGTPGPTRRRQSGPGTPHRHAHKPHQRFPGGLGPAEFDPFVRFHHTPARGATGPEGRAGKHAAVPDSDPAENRDTAPGPASHPTDAAPPLPSRAEYDGAEMKFRPESDEFWRRRVEVVILGHDDDGNFIDPDGNPFSTGHDRAFLLLRNGKLVATSDPSAEHPHLYNAYLSEHADANERRAAEKSHGPSIIAGAGYWRLTEGKPELIGAFSGLIWDHATETSKFWVQLRYHLSRRIDLSTVHWEFGKENIGRAWWESPENGGEYAAAELIPEPGFTGDRGPLAKAVSAHLRGGGDDFWFDVERVRFPYTGGMSMDVLVHPVLGEPARATIDVTPAGTTATAHYRDFDPGPEPERTYPAFRTAHDVLTRWLTASGFTWEEGTDAVLMPGKAVADPTAASVPQFRRPSEEAVALFQRILDAEQADDPHAQELRAEAERRIPDEGDRAYTERYVGNARRAAALAAELGITPEQLRVLMTQELRQVFGGEIVIRTKAITLGRILASGRFKTLFETAGRSLMARAQLARRVKIEQKMFGYASDLPVELRPIYARVRTTRGSWDREGRIADEHGDVDVVLASTVENRTTASVGDPWGVHAIPSSVTDPQPESFAAIPSNHRELAYFGLEGIGRDYAGERFLRNSYIEAQIHGGVPVTDIAHVVFHREPPDRGLQAELAAAGIPWSMASDYSSNGRPSHSPDLPPSAESGPVGTPPAPGAAPANDATDSDATTPGPASRPADADRPLPSTREARDTAADQAAAVTDRTGRHLLSEREIAVLRLLDEGRSHDEVAATLGVRPGTVHNHQTSASVKLGTSGKIQTLAEARRQGLLDRADSPLSTFVQQSAPGSPSTAGSPRQNDQTETSDLENTITPAAPGRSLVRQVLPDDVHTAEILGAEHSAARSVRLCVEQALQSLGLDGEPVRVGLDGEPEFRGDLVGATVQTDAYSAAAVAHAPTVAIGLDAKNHVTVQPAALVDITSPKERRRLRELVTAHPEIHWDQISVSAKDNVLALHRRMSGHQSTGDRVEITLRPHSAEPTTGTFEAKLPTAPGQPPSTVTGAFCVRRGIVLTGIALRESGNEPDYPEGLSPIDGGEPSVLPATDGGRSPRPEPLPEAPLASSTTPRSHDKHTAEHLTPGPAPSAETQRPTWTAPTELGRRADDGVPNESTGPQPAPQSGVGLLRNVLPPEVHTVELRGSARSSTMAVLHCAEQALRDLDLADTPIQPRPDGEPHWPGNLVGATARTDKFAGVALTGDTTFRIIGLDAKNHVAAPSALIFNATQRPERFRMRNLAQEHSDVRWDQVLVSVKDNVLDVHRRSTGHQLHHNQVEVTLYPDTADPRSGSFEVRLPTEAAAVSDAVPTVLSGRFHADADTVVTAIALRHPENDAPPRASIRTEPQADAAEPDGRSATQQVSGLTDRASSAPENNAKPTPWSKQQPTTRQSEPTLAPAESPAPGKPETHGASPSPWRRRGPRSPGLIGGVPDLVNPFDDRGKPWDRGGPVPRRQRIAGLVEPHADGGGFARGTRQQPTTSEQTREPEHRSAEPAHPDNARGRALRPADASAPAPHDHTSVGNGDGRALAAVKAAAAAALNAAAHGGHHDLFRLRHTIRQLGNPDYEKFLELRFLQGLSVADATAAVGGDRTADAAKSLRRRAVGALARMLPLNPPELLEILDASAPRTELTEKAYRIGWENALTQSLRATILSGRLREGRWLPTAPAFAEHLGLPSPAPVRNAYQQLSQEGYVAIKKGVGATIASHDRWPSEPASDVVVLTPEQLLEIFTANSSSEDLVHAAGGDWRVMVTSALRDAILTDRLPAGRLLPSAKELGDYLHMSKSAVERAYRQLITEGYLVGKFGVGTRVASRPWRNSDPDVPTPPPTPTTPPRGHGLTELDVEVLELAAEGRSRKQIAEALDITPRDVSYRFERIRLALGVNGDRAEIVAVAEQRQIIGNGDHRGTRNAANPLPPGVELFHHVDPNPADAHFPRRPHGVGANKQRNLNQHLLEFHHHHGHDDDRFWDRPHPESAPRDSSEIDEDGFTAAASAPDYPSDGLRYSDLVSSPWPDEAAAAAVRNLPTSAGPLGPELTLDFLPFFASDGLRTEEDVEAVAAAVGDMMREQGWRGPAQIEAAAELVRAAGLNAVRYMTSYSDSLASGNVPDSEEHAALDGMRATLTLRMTGEAGSRSLRISLEVNQYRPPREVSDERSEWYAPLYSRDQIGAEVLAPLGAATNSDIEQWGEVWARFDEPRAAEDSSQVSAPRLRGDFETKAEVVRNLEDDLHIRMLGWQDVPVAAVESADRKLRALTTEYGGRFALRDFGFEEIDEDYGATQSFGTTKSEAKDHYTSIRLNKGMFTDPEVRRGWTQRQLEHFFAQSPEDIVSQATHHEFIHAVVGYDNWKLLTLAPEVLRAAHQHFVDEGLLPAQHDFDEWLAQLPGYAFVNPIPLTRTFHPDEGVTEGARAGAVVSSLPLTHPARVLHWLTVTRDGSSPAEFLARWAQRQDSGDSDISLLLQDFRDVTGRDDIAIPTRLRPEDTPIEILLAATGGQAQHFADAGDIAARLRTWDQSSGSPGDGVSALVVSAGEAPYLLVRRVSPDGHTRVEVRNPIEGVLRAAHVPSTESPRPPGVQGIFFDETGAAIPVPLGEAAGDDRAAPQTSAADSPRFNPQADPAVAAGIAPERFRHPASRRKSGIIPPDAHLAFHRNPDNGRSWDEHEPQPRDRRTSDHAETARPADADDNPADTVAPGPAASGLEASPSIRRALKTAESEADEILAEALYQARRLGVDTTTLHRKSPAEIEQAIEDLQDRQRRRFEAVLRRLVADDVLARVLADQEPARLLRRHYERLEPHIEAARKYVTEVRRALSILAARDVLVAEGATPFVDDDGKVVEGIGVAPGNRVVVVSPFRDQRRLLDQQVPGFRELAAQRGIRIEYRHVRIDEHGRLTVEPISGIQTEPDPEIRLYRKRLYITWLNSLTDERSFAEKVQDAYDSGELVRELLKGDSGDRTMSESVWLVTYRNGYRLIEKTVRDVLQADAEELGARTLSDVGARTPGLLRRAERVLLVEFLPGSDADAVMGLPSEDAWDHFFHTPSAMRLGLGDMLIRPWDRHEGKNWRLQYGFLVRPIDNSNAYQYNSLPGGFTLHYGARDDNGDMVWRQHHISRAELAVDRQRIEASEREYTRLGRRWWYRVVLYNFAQIEKNAEEDSARSRIEPAEAMELLEEIRDRLAAKLRLPGPYDARTQQEWRNAVEWLYMRTRGLDSTEYDTSAIREDLAALDKLVKLHLHQQLNEVSADELDDEWVGDDEAAGTRPTLIDAYLDGLARRLADLEDETRYPDPNGESDAQWQARFEREIRDTTSPVTLPDTALGTAADSLRACIPYLVRLADALGHDNTRPVADDADTWIDLESGITAQLLEVAPRDIDAHPTADELGPADPLRGIVDTVRDPDHPADAAAIVVDNGADAHAYLVTTIEGNVFVIDSLIPSPGIRPYERWSPSYHHVEKAFVGYFTRENGVLTPLHAPIPDHIDRPHPQRPIKGAPGTPDHRSAGNGFARGIRSESPGDDSRLSSTPDELSSSVRLALRSEPGMPAGGVDGVLRQLKQALTAAYMDLEGVGESDPVVEALSETPEEEFAAHFHQLRPVQQGALLLRYHQGRSETEVARMLNAVEEPAQPLGDVVTRTLIFGAVRRLVRSIAAEQGMPDTDDRLTPNERRHLELLAQGLTATEISETVGCAPKTAMEVIEGIVRKFRSENKAAAVAEATRRGTLNILEFPVAANAAIALSAEDQAVLVLIAKGHTGSSIARAMTESAGHTVSPGQVKGIMDRVGRAFGLRDRAGLVSVALREGILDVNGSEWLRWGSRTSTEIDLSEREATVLELLANGMTNPSIAAHLGLSVGAIGAYRQKLKRKLGVSTHEALLEAARRRGIEIVAPEEPGVPEFSEREIEVLGRLAMGTAYGEIATELGIAKGTVLTYVRRIRAKLALGPEADLLEAAQNIGIDLDVNVAAFNAEPPSDSTRGAQRNSDQTPESRLAPSQPSPPASAAEQRFIRWFRRRLADESGQPRQSMAQYVKMHHLLSSQVNRWLTRAGLDPTELASVPSGQFPLPDGDDSTTWMSRVRAYLGLPHHQMDELIDAPWTWKPAEEGNRQLKITHVRALLRRVPGASEAYMDVARLYPALLTADGEPAYPEGYTHIGNYLEFCREYRNGEIEKFFEPSSDYVEYKIYTGAAVAHLTGLSPIYYSEIEKGRSRPSKFAARRLFAAVPPPYGVTGEELAERFEYLPRVTLIYPHPSVADSLGEYSRHFREVNHLTQEEVATIFDIQGKDLSAYESATMRSRELRVLKVHDRVLHRAGPWNELAEAWGYRYRMDPAGETHPDPADYASVNDWLGAERLYRRMSPAEFDAQVEIEGLTYYLNGRHRPLLTFLREIRDKLGIRRDRMRAAVLRFYQRRDIADQTTDDDELIWKHIEAPVGSPEEAAARDQLLEKYAWVADMMARRWRNAGEYEDLVQRGLEKILTAIRNATPGTNMYALSLANTRFAMRGAFAESRNPDADRKTGEMLRTVSAYINRHLDETDQEPDDADIAHATDLTVAQVTEARRLLAQRMHSLDEPIGEESGGSRHDLRAQSIFTAEDVSSSGFYDVEFEDTLNSALSDLTEPDLTKQIVLHLMEDQTLDEVAASLGITIEHAGRLLGEARDSLRTAFGRPHEKNGVNGASLRISPPPTDPHAGDRPHPREAAKPQVHPYRRTAELSTDPKQQSSRSRGHAEVAEPMDDAESVSESSAAESGRQRSATVDGEANAERGPAVGEGITAPIHRRAATRRIGLIGGVPDLVDPFDDRGAPWDRGGPVPRHRRINRLVEPHADGGGFARGRKQEDPAPPAVSEARGTVPNEAADNGVDDSVGQRISDLEARFVELNRMTVQRHMEGEAISADRLNRAYGQIEAELARLRSTGAVSDDVPVAVGSDRRLALDSVFEPERAYQQAYRHAMGALLRYPAVRANLAPTETRDPLAEIRRAIDRVTELAADTGRGAEIEEIEVLATIFEWTEQAEAGGRPIAVEKDQAGPQDRAVPSMTATGRTSDSTHTAGAAPENAPAAPVQEDRRTDSIEIRRERGSRSGHHAALPDGAVHAVPEPDETADLGTLSKLYAALMPDGRTVHFRLLGNPHGYPILLSPGTPVGVDGPLPDPRALYNRGFALIVVERPGYGDSDPLPGRTVADCARDIIYIATELFAFDHYSVLGRSGGGSVAIAVGALDPDHVDRVVSLVGTAPRLDDMGEWMAGMADANQRIYARPDLESMAATLTEMAENIARDGEWLLRYNQDAFTRVDHMWVGTHRKEVARGYQRALRNYPQAWADDAIQLTGNWGIRFDQYRVPVDIVHGAADQFSPVDHSRDNARLIPTSKLYIFRGVSHMMGMDALPVIARHFRAERDAFYRARGDDHRIQAIQRAESDPLPFPRWMYWSRGPWDSRPDYADDSPVLDLPPQRARGLDGLAFDPPPAVADPFGGLPRGVPPGAVAHAADPNRREGGAFVRTAHAPASSARVQNGDQPTPLEDAHPTTLATGSEYWAEVDAAIEQVVAINPAFEYLRKMPKPAEGAPFGAEWVSNRREWFHALFHEDTETLRNIELTEKDLLELARLIKRAPLYMTLVLVNVTGSSIDQLVHQHKVDWRTLFLKQEKITGDGETIPVWKIRTLPVDTPEKASDRNVINEITPWARLQRTTSMDELPQLALIAAGVMQYFSGRPMLNPDIELMDDARRRGVITEEQYAFWIAYPKDDLWSAAFFPGCRWLEAQGDDYLKARVLCAFIWSRMGSRAAEEYLMEVIDRYLFSTVLREGAEFVLGTGTEIVESITGLLPGQAGQKLLETGQQVFGGVTGRIGNAIRGLAGRAADLVYPAPEDRPGAPGNDNPTSEGRKTERDTETRAPDVGINRDAADGEVDLDEPLYVAHVPDDLDGPLYVVEPEEEKAIRGEDEPIYIVSLDAIPSVSPPLRDLLPVEEYRHLGGDQGVVLPRATAVALRDAAVEHGERMSGSYNNIYLLGDFAIRVRKQGPEQLDFVLWPKEYQTLRALAQAGVQGVPQVLHVELDNQGDVLFQIQRRIYGAPVSNLHSPQVSAALVAMSRQLDQVPVPQELLPLPAWYPESGDSAGFFRMLMEHTEQIYQRYRSVERYRTIFGRLGLGESLSTALEPELRHVRPQQFLVIHGDLTSANVLKVSSGHAIVDFELALYGPKDYEAAVLTHRSPGSTRGLDPYPVHLEPWLHLLDMHRVIVDTVRLVEAANSPDPGHFRLFELSWNVTKSLARASQHSPGREVLSVDEILRLVVALRWEAAIDPDEDLYLVATPDEPPPPDTSDARSSD
ncbi:alpha/beta fold hydrolase [Nocardia asiatica]|uniref:alpha/beta fold hydrolase n=1 Tax=Nocardia asiatica TaxID=209252 RepID=UPI003EE11037